MAKAGDLKILKSKGIDSELLTKKIVQAIQEIKGRDINTIDLRNISNSISEFIVICHGDSNTQIEAITRSVEEIVKRDLGEKPAHVEGLENCEWVLIDYFSVIVHVFKKDRRDYFQLERLWADAYIQKIAGNY